jgi:micrococcal nuclease
MWKRAFFAVMSLLVAGLFANDGPARAGQFKITKVYDGDTVKAEAGQTVVYVMLVGTDAPEVSTRSGQPSQAFGEEAKTFLSSMVLGEEVEVAGYGLAPDPDDKIVGVIYVRGKNVNLEMVKRGMAEVCRENLPRGFDVEPYLAAETEAKAGRIGIWSLGEAYVSPREWRKEHRMLQP